MAKDWPDINGCADCREKDARIKELECVIDSTRDVVADQLTRIAALKRIKEAAIAYKAMIEHLDNWFAYVSLGCDPIKVTNDLEAALRGDGEVGKNDNKT